MMRPVIVVAITLRGIDITTMFTNVFVMTQGTPGGATETMSYFIYRQGFRMFNFGYASAASVLVPLVQRDDGLHVLLTRRADHLRDHAGQISFPGGRAEAFDADAAATGATWSRGCGSINWMILLPITTASATRPMAWAVAASRMPKPTPTGMCTCSRMRGNMASTASVSKAPEPVTPLSET